MTYESEFEILFERKLLIINILFQTSLKYKNKSHDIKKFILKMPK
jgi:hypothetical protein